MTTFSNPAALIIEGRSTAVNSNFIQSLAHQPDYEVARIIAESDLELGQEIRELDLQQWIGISKAIKLAVQYGGIDGAHHKDWVIDQMVRALTTPEQYQQIVKDACAGEDGPNTYEWDEGIAP